MAAKTLLSLYNQLLQYGLNPNEWVIETHQEEVLEIYNIEDPEFRFQGQIENSHWKQIWLASI